MEGQRPIPEINDELEQVREELDELVRRRRFFGLSDKEDKRYRELLEREHELLHGESPETSRGLNRFRWR